MRNLPRLARLYVDRLEINRQARTNLISLLLALKGKITVTDLKKLILEAGYLEDYKNYGTDVASIRIAFKKLPVSIKRQTSLFKMFEDIVNRH